MSLLSRPYGICVIAAFAAGACSGNFDTTRERRPFEDRATLGQEIFGALCDRLGASALAEDLDGESYNALCHPDGEGRYRSTVDSSLLPPIREGTPVAAMARNLGVAKMEALARRRQDLVKSFDTILPDVEIHDPFAPHGGPTKVRLHTAVAELLQRLNPLYDSNPLAAEGGTPDPLLPASTQALARVFQALIASEDARVALQKIGGRKGYRPLSSALGVIAPVLAYPDLRKISQQTVRVLSPGGPAREQFVQLLTVAQEELRTAETRQCKDEPDRCQALAPTDNRAQPNRYRRNLEILQDIAFMPDNAFGLPGLSSGPIVRRDYRGFAQASGSQLGVPGSVPTPFSDADQDGLADVDDFGRFIDIHGNLVSVDPPFVVPGEPLIREPNEIAKLDNGEPAYKSIDTTKTMLASLLLRDLPALLNPDPAAQHETLLDALAGLVPLLGDRADAIYAYGEGNEQVGIKYRQFVPSTSPLLALVHAAGQILAHPQSDDLLQQLIDLFKNHEQKLARLVGVALEIKELSDKHPEAVLDRKAFVWDHTAQVVAKMTAVTQGDPTGALNRPWNHDETSLIEDIVLSLANPRSDALDDVYSKFFIYRDEMNYDPNNVNGPAVNRTSGDGQPPHILVDRSKPITGNNKSMFMRSLNVVFDSTRTKACNRAGAQVHLKAGVLGLKLDMTYPSDVLFRGLCIGKVKNPLDWCDIFEIKDMTQFYLQSLLESDPNPPGPLKVPRKATLEVKDACLNSLGGLADMDKTFEDSSGIEGLTTHPTYTALDRMVFFGAATPSYVMPDLDPFLGDSSHPNYRTNRFISGLQDPVGSPLCPKNAAGVNHCTGPHDVLRQRNPGTLFLWEQFGFADASRPLFFTFYKYDREDLFSDLVDVMHYHWPDSTHGAECEPKGGFDRDKPGFNPLYCSEAGLVRYEELLSEALKTDALAAAQQIVKVLRDQRIKSTRYRADQGHARIERRGTELAAFLTRLLFSEKESAAMGLATLDGKRTVLWSDEKTIKNQVTPFDLVANAIKGIDDRFASAKDFSTDELQERQERWKRARSQLVDQFLAVEGSGSGARFKNPAVPKAIVRGLELLREQLNFRCPHREVGEQCTWAKTELTQKVSDVLEDPLFAAIVDLVDELRKDPGRIELERLAQYLLGAIDNEPTLHAVLASAADAIQLLQDRQTLPPILNVLSALAVPDDAAGSDGARLAPGAADISLQLLNVLSRDPDASVPVDDTLMFDRYHVLDHILPNLVKPIDKSKPSETAIEVLIDVAADVHRHDSAEQEPLTAEDYRVIASSLNEFLTDERRGMEQLYTVVRAAEGN